MVTGPGVAATARAISSTVWGVTTRPMVTGYNPVTSVTRTPLSGSAVTGTAGARQKPIRLTTAPYSTRMAKVSPALRSQRRTRCQIVRGGVPSGTSTRLRERNHVIG